MSSRVAPPRTLSPRSIVIVVTNSLEAMPLNPLLYSGPKQPLPPKLEMRHNHRPILRRRRERAVALHHKVHCETQLAQPGAILRLAGGLAGHGVRRRGHLIGVVRQHGDVVAAAHELLELARVAAGVGVEDLHHVLLGVADLVLARLLPVGRDVVRPVVVQHLENVLRRRRRHDRRRDDLVHGLVVAGVCGVVHEACAGGVDV